MGLATTAVRSISVPVGRLLKDDFVRHSALVFSASMATNILNYLFNFAISRRLGVEGFATLSSLVSGLTILSIPAAVTTLVVVKYAATFHAAGDSARIRRLSSLLLKSTGAAAAAAFVIGLLLHGEIANFLKIPADGAITLTVFLIALGFVSPTLRGILQGEQDFLRYSVSLVLETLLKFALAVALVYAGWGVFGAMLGWVLASICGLIYTAWAVWNKHGSASKLSVRLSLDLRRLLQTTAGVAGATGLLTMIGFMDVVLVKHYFSPTEAGLYAAVNFTGKIVLFVVGFVPAIVLPKAVARVENGNSPSTLLLQSALLTGSVLAVTLAVFGLVPGKALTLLAGHAFSPAAPYVFQYDVAMALLAVLTLMVNYKIGIHRFDFLYTLTPIFLCEIAAIAVWHRTLWDVIHVLLVANALAIVACSYRINAPLRHDRALPVT